VTVKTLIMPKIKRVVMVGQLSGMMILKNSLIGETPSILQLSRISLGIRLMPAVRRMTS
jgi:hypothetical protein